MVEVICEDIEDDVGDGLDDVGVFQAAPERESWVKSIVRLRIADGAMPQRTQTVRLVLRQHSFHRG